MMNTEMIDQDGCISFTGNTKFIGPVVPPWLEKAANTGDTVADDELSDYSSNDDGNDYASEWVNATAARSIRKRILGLPYDEKEAYNMDELVPSTLGEETQPPPDLYEPDRNSAAGIDPATDTGQALSGNCSGRKTVGQVLSNSMEIDGTAGSGAILERDFPE